MAYDIETLNQARSKAMIHIMATPDSAFFATGAFSLKYVWDETHPTACTDGLQVRINPDFFMALTNEERAFLIVHETCHVLYLHITRLMERDSQIFNIAADYVINLHLVERGWKMPKNGLLDKQFHGMSTEQVYDLIVNKAPPANFVMDMEEGKLDSADLEQQVQDIIIRASIQSKMENDRPGTIPGEIQLFLDNLLKPKLPWNRILKRWLQALCKDDYSFRKPNRRFFPQHILPSLHSEKVMDFAVAVDISGSVSDHEFHTFVSEVASIFKMMKPNKITLIQFDTAIKSITPLTNFNDLMKVKFTGRGGTDITEMIDWVNTNKPQLTLVFTDGGFRFYENNTHQQIVWLIHNNPTWQAKFGKLIHYRI